MSDYGNSLREGRTRRCLTVAQVARHIGVSQPFLSDVERGRTKPLLPEKTLAVAELLGLPARILLLQAARERGYFEVPFREDGRLYMAYLKLLDISDLDPE